MKHLMYLLVMVFGFTINGFAQDEVRGHTTLSIEFEGEVKTVDLEQEYTQSEVQQVFSSQTPCFGLGCRTVPIYVYIGGDLAFEGSFIIYPDDTMGSIIDRLLILFF
ncbi:MAG: hypothetical protein KIG88_10655 [Weeksellaceae bacterium]|nr:hypothetical protein [Weeksellaceae bacterium]